MLRWGVGILGGRSPPRTTTASTMRMEAGQARSDGGRRDQAVRSDALPYQPGGANTCCGCGRCGGSGWLGGRSPPTGLEPPVPGPLTVATATSFLSLSAARVARVGLLEASPFFPPLFAFVAFAFVAVTPSWRVSLWPSRQSPSWQVAFVAIAFVAMPGSPQLPDKRRPLLGDPRERALQDVGLLRRDTDFRGFLTGCAQEWP